MTCSMPENDSYDAHARTCDPSDLWGQVKRTINGKPLPDAQIELILASVTDALALSPRDVLLDLCCGNGALSTHWFAGCADGVGVDASPYLIEVARRHFAPDTPERFVLAEALDYLRSTVRRRDFTKAVCYGSLQYFSVQRAHDVLTALRTHCPALTRVVIGNVPDRDRAAAFFRAQMPESSELDSPLSPIGMWHTRQGFAAMARRSGWECETRIMPASFHAAHYRFDAILTPSNGGIR